MTDRRRSPTLVIVLTALGLAAALFAVGWWLRPGTTPEIADGPPTVAPPPSEPPRPRRLEPVEPPPDAPPAPVVAAPAAPPAEPGPWETRLTAAMLDVHTELEACLPEPLDPDAPVEPVAAIFDVDFAVGERGTKPDNIRFNTDLPPENAACLREVLDAVRFEESDVRTGQTFLILPRG